MNFSHNQLVPQFVPPLQMVNSALPYTQPSPFVGKVVRVRANIYIFVCDYCMSEHRSIDNFLHHTEGHFVHGIPSAHSNQHPSFAPAPGATINTNGLQPAPYPVQLQQSQLAPVDDDPNITDEVYEIIDLGYDFDGNYPNAIPIDENRGQRSKSKRQQAKPTPMVQRAKTKVQKHSKPKDPAAATNQKRSHQCSFCVRNFTKESALTQHLTTTHAKVFKKIESQKKAYKCKICGEKFAKSAYELHDAYEHLKIHYNN